MGVPTVAQVRSWAGLDVHAAKVIAATMDRESGELVVRRLPGATGEVVEFCAGLPSPACVAYEPGRPGSGWRCLGTHCILYEAPPSIVSVIGGVLSGPTGPVGHPDHTHFIGQTPEGELRVGQLLAGDPEQPGSRLARLGPVAAPRRQRRGERLGGQVGGQLGVARAAGEVGQHAVDVLDVEALERGASRAASSSASVSAGRTTTSSLSVLPRLCDRFFLGHKRGARAEVVHRSDPLIQGGGA